MKLSKVCAALAGAAVLPLAVSPALAADHHKSSGMSEAKTVVGVASGNDDFSTLVAAVKAGELVETLSGDGPFTVFAPTNAAFDALPEGTVPALLKPENRQALRMVLTYHVVPGKVKAGDLVKLIRDNDGSAKVGTVEGSELTASIMNGDVVLTDIAGQQIKVVSTNIDASNGVIHVVDGVLLPATGEQS